MFTLLLFTDRKADAEVQKRQSGAAMDLDDSSDSDEEHEEPDLPATPVEQLGKFTSKPAL